MKRILTVVGTRPNFIKVTRFREVASRYAGYELHIVHTGQHYDDKMADVFFRQFNLVPDHFLNTPQGSPASQIAFIITELEKLILKLKPDVMLVVGDVNSTMAAAIAANKCGVKLGHVESGLRSFDRTMPEEYNRIVADELSDLLFVTEQSGLDNLNAERKPKEAIHFVGNTMIDTMVAFAPQIESSDILEQLNAASKNYVLMTMHRPATVDDETGLKKLLELIKDVCAQYPLIFPVHPRTVATLKKFGLHDEFTAISNLTFVEPLDYFAFQKLVKHAKFILTDSGGIQEESTFLGVPCLTLRPNTERPSTVTIGSNELLPFDLQMIRARIADIVAGTYKKGGIPPLWDGKATERIFDVLSKTI